MKPGWKSTEFALTVLFVLLGAVGFAFGKIDSEQAMAVVGIGLAIGGYSMSRGAAKGGPSMLVPFALAACIGLSACGTTARGYLRASLDNLAKVDGKAIPEAEQKCVAAVSKCEKVPPEKCLPFVQCQSRFICYKEAMKKAGDGLKEANRALEKLEVK